VLLVTGFSLVVDAVDDIIGITPNNERAPLVDTGFPWVMVGVGDDKIGAVPKNGVIELVVIIGFSLVVTDNDAGGVVLNDEKVVLMTLVVTAGGIGKIFSWVVVGTVWLTLGSLVITSGNLLDDTGSFPNVTVGSLALGFL
jgi:hypothetical protein